ncbi:MAG: NAD-dependent epimerase/dehydratase family protein [Egibacteraceae bacterium]
MEHVNGHRVLVTGGSGFIGSAVVAGLLEHGASVTVLDRQPHPDPRIDSVVAELEEPAARESAVSRGVSGIIHLAAATSVLRSMQDPVGVYAANVAVTAGLLELARTHGVDRFILASTNAVTGDVGRQPIHERMPLRPLTPYGATKAACEMLLSGYAGSYGLAGSALRFTNVYGPGMGHKDSFVPRLMRAALAGGGVQVYGDGQQVRDFVHVDDVVDSLLLAWRTRHVGPLIVGSGRSISVNELVAEARAVSDSPLPVEHTDPKPGEMPAVIVDIAAARELGYRPTVSLRGGLAGVWGDFRRQEGQAFRGQEGQAFRRQGAQAPTAASVPGQ